MNKDGHRELTDIYKKSGMNNEAIDAMLNYYNLLLIRLKIPSFNEIEGIHTGVGGTSNKLTKQTEEGEEAEGRKDSQVFTTRGEESWT